MEMYSVIKTLFIQVERTGGFAVVVVVEDVVETAVEPSREAARFRHHGRHSRLSSMRQVS